MIRRVFPWVVAAPLLITSLSFAAQTPWQSNPQGKVRLISSWDVVPSTGAILLGFQFQPTPGWTLYWKEAGDAGIPPKVLWSGLHGLASPTLLFPAPTRFTLPGDIVEYGYEGETIHPVRAERTTGDVSVTAVLSYLTCNTSCIPYKYTFIFKVPSGAPRPDAASTALLEQALARVPAASLSDADVRAKAPTVALHPGELPPAEEDASRSLWQILLLAFVGGIILNGMPCVLPVLSIKLLGLLRHGGSSRLIVARDALASAAGIWVSFMVLAGGVVAARQAGHAAGWGVQFQEPVFVGALVLVLFLFALNLWGIFEIQLPRAFARLGAVSDEDEGLGSFFASGLFATLLATPCSAPFLGSAMGFALTQRPPVIFLIFFAVGTGLALPYLLLALFPAAVQWLPRPGAWMLRVKAGLAFLLAGTAAWLFFVLSNQVSPGGVLGFAFCLLASGFAVWCREFLAEKNRYGTAARGAFWVFLAGLTFGGLAFLRTHRVFSNPSEERQEGLVWRPFSEVAVTESLSQGKRVFVDVTADWCLTCKVNERGVLRRPKVVEALKAPDLVLLRADWTNYDPAIGDFLRRYGRAGIPFYALFRPAGAPILLSEFLTQRQVLDALSDRR